MADIGQRIGPFELVRWIASDRDTSLFHAIRPDSSRHPREVAIRVANVIENNHAVQLIDMEYKILSNLEDKRIPKPLAHYAGQAAIAKIWGQHSLRLLPT